MDIPPPESLRDTKTGIVEAPMHRDKLCGD